MNNVRKGLLFSVTSCVVADKIVLIVVDFLSQSLFLDIVFEWLDSVGIYIQHWSSGGSFREEFDVDVAYKGKLHSSDEFYPTRGEAIESGIKIANEIYNTRVSKAEGEKLS